MDNRVEIRVGAQDNSKLDLASLQEKLKKLGSTVATARARVDGDKEAELKVERLALKLAALGKKVESPRIGLMGAARAEVEIAAVGLALDKVGDKVGQSGGSSGLMGKLSRLGGVFKGIGGLAAGALGAGLTGPLAAAGLAVGAFGAVAAPTISKIEKALTTTGAAGKTAWAQLDPAQRNLAQTIQGLQGKFDGLQQKLAPVVTSVGTLAVKTASDLLPSIGTLAQAGGKVISDFLTPFDNLVKSPFFAGFVTQMSNLAVKVGPVLGTTLTGLLKVFMQLFMQAGPAAIQILQKLLPAIVGIAGGLVPVIAGITNIVAGIVTWLSKNNLLIPALIALGAALTIAGGPISAVVGGLALVVGGLVDLWQHSQTFRDIVTGAFSVVGRVVLTFAELWLDEMHTISDGMLDAAHYILVGVKGVAQAIDFVMGTHLADGVQTALDNLDGFKRGVDNTFDAAHNKLEGWKRDLSNMPKKVKLQGDISDLTNKLNNAKAQLKDPNLTKTRRAQIDANIAQLQRQIAYARAQLDALNGKTATTYITTVSRQVMYQAATGQRGGIGGGPMRASGGLVGGAASGGIRGSLVEVGEHGRELVQLPAGSMVHSNPDTERMLGQGGGDLHITLELGPSFRKAGLTQQQLEDIRYTVRTKGGRGPGAVERAFGGA